MYSFNIWNFEDSIEIDVHECDSKTDLPKYETRKQAVLAATIESINMPPLTRQLLLDNIKVVDILIPNAPDNVIIVMLEKLIRNSEFGSIQNWDADRNKKIIAVTEEEYNTVSSNSLITNKRRRN